MVGVQIAKNRYGTSGQKSGIDTKIETTQKPIQHTVVDWCNESNYTVMVAATEPFRDLMKKHARMEWVENMEKHLK